MSPASGVTGLGEALAASDAEAAEQFSEREVGDPRLPCAQDSLKLALTVEVESSPVLALTVEVEPPPVLALTVEIEPPESPDSPVFS